MAVPLFNPSWDVQNADTFPNQNSHIGHRNTLSPTLALDPILLALDLVVEIALTIYMVVVGFKQLWISG
jgi:hypothetical protein